MARWVVLAGLTALLIVGYFANYSDSKYLGLKSLKVIAAELQIQAEAALKRDGLDSWASVKVNGQIAEVSGEARTEGERDAAIASVTRAIWQGGPWIGGIVAVQSIIALSPAQSPFTWIGTLADGRVLQISGFVPSDEIKADLYAYALTLFPTGVTDTSVIARGVPRGEWAAGVKWGLSQLNKLSGGAAEFKDTQFHLRGITDKPLIQIYVKNAVEQISPPFAGTSDIALVGETVAPAPAAEATEPSAVALTAPRQPSVSVEPEAANRSAAAKACQVDVDYARENTTIEFDSNAATLKPDSFGALDKIATVAGDCPALKLIVSGHTDATGSPELNRSLSRARAAAVVTYLKSKGVQAERLQARGYGPDKPIDSNDTEAGKARNRRIDITVVD